MSFVTPNSAAVAAAGSVPTRPLNIVIAGLGSIGRRHLANLQTVEPSVRSIVWHQHSRPGSGGESEANTVVYSLEAALAERPDAAIVAGPSPSHVETSLALAEHGVHLLVEKPISDRIEGVDALTAVCRSRQLVLMIGYCFRFYRPLRAVREAIMAGRIGRVMSARAEVGSYLPEWRRTDYRRSVTARRDLGGGVLLELSHEIDYLRWMLGEVTEVGAVVRSLGDLDIDVEDTAEILMEFCSGAIGSVHLDMTQRVPSRGCRVVGTEGTIVWHASAHQARLFSSVSREWTVLHKADPMAYQDMYQGELRQFVDAVNGGDMEGATAEDGRRVLELTLAARRASDERRTISVPEDLR